jgi:hypothetical protein
MPGELSEDAGLDPVLRIGTPDEILREQLLAARMRDEVLIEKLELLGRDGLVVVPPHGVLGHCIADRELVLRRAAGIHAGIGAERAAYCQFRFAGA